MYIDVKEVANKEEENNEKVTIKLLVPVSPTYLYNHINS